MSRQALELPLIPRRGWCGRDHRVCSLLRLLALVLVLPSGVRAQIEGRVVDVQGIPVAYATVKLRGGGTTLATTLTDSIGRFVFRANPQAESILVSAMGLAAAEVPLSDLSHSLNVVLAPEPIALPPLETASAPFRCPETDDPRARELWIEAVAQYAAVDSGQMVQARVTELRRGETWPEEFGNTSALALRGAVAGGRAGHPLWTADAVLRNGYALPEKWSSFDGRFESWRYLDLGGTQAYFLQYHWFVELQTLGVVVEDEQGVTMAFCDVRRHEPSLTGRLHLDPQGWIRTIEWKMPTPEPEEDSGGQAFFRAGSEYLLPESSVFWRKTSMGKYFQETRRFGPWRVGEGEAPRS